MKISIEEKLEIIEKIKGHEFYCNEVVQFCNQFRKKYETIYYKCRLYHVIIHSTPDENQIYCGDILGEITEFIEKEFEKALKEERHKILTEAINLTFNQFIA